MEMTWEQKLAALQVLTDTSLRMRKPGDWYVSAVGRAIGGDGMLTGDYGNGATPAEAVEDDWRRMTDLPPEKYVVIDCVRPARRWRWAGFMWQPVEE